MNSGEDCLQLAGVTEVVDVRLLVAACMDRRVEISCIFIVYSPANFKYVTQSLLTGISCKGEVCRSSSLTSSSKRGYLVSVVRIDDS